MKRRIALLRSLNRPTEAITALIRLLDAVPTDAEGWCELADLYQSQGLGAQAIFSLEEALLIAPNAWNVWVHLSAATGIEDRIDLLSQIHARLGELLYTCASSSDSDSFRLAGKSVQHFCRSIELCDDYLRGFYGLVLVRLWLARWSLEVSSMWFSLLANRCMSRPPHGYWTTPPATVLRILLPLRIPSDA